MCSFAPSYAESLNKQPTWRPNNINFLVIEQLQITTYTQISYTEISTNLCTLWDERTDQYDRSISRTNASKDHRMNWDMRTWHSSTLNHLLMVGLYGFRSNFMRQNIQKGSETNRQAIISDSPTNNLAWKSSMYLHVQCSE